MNITFNTKSFQFSKQKKQQPKQQESNRIIGGPGTQNKSTKKSSPILFHRSLVPTLPLTSSASNSTTIQNKSGHNLGSSNQKSIRDTNKQEDSLKPSPVIHLLIQSASTSSSSNNNNNKSANFGNASSQISHNSNLNSLINNTSNNLNLELYKKWILLSLQRYEKIQFIALAPLLAQSISMVQQLKSMGLVLVQSLETATMEDIENKHTPVSCLVYSLRLPF